MCVCVEWVPSENAILTDLKPQPASAFVVATHGPHACVENGIRGRKKRAKKHDTKKSVIHHLSSVLQLVCRQIASLPESLPAALNRTHERLFPCSA